MSVCVLNSFILSSFDLMFRISNLNGIYIRVKANKKYEEEITETNNYESRNFIRFIIIISKPI